MSREETTQDEGWEDDDDDNLFSFGADAGAVTPEAADVEKFAEPSGADSMLDPLTRERTGSDDSFLDMLDDNKPEGDSLLMGGVPPPTIDDKDTQEILGWLDVEQSPATSVMDSASTAASEGTSQSPTESPVIVEAPKVDEGAPQSKPAQDSSRPGEPSNNAASTASELATNAVLRPEPMPTIVDLPPPKAPSKPVFETLQQALESNQSTISDIRALFLRDKMKIAAESRPHLWSRIICGKSLEDISKSSVAESFQHWRASENKNQPFDWIKQESAILGERIAACTDGNLEQARLNLEHVLFFYYQKEAEAMEMDHLLPPVACAILSAGVSPESASVVLSNIMPAFMPILALNPTERLDCAKSLHSHLYLLACYHLPLLVFHLDRYAPGWYWPKLLSGETGGTVEIESATQKGRNLENQGVVPQSWLISHLAGECKGTLMNPMWLLSLWDLILTSSNNSLRFFLSLALLEKHADTLLMLTGDELLKELHRIMEFKVDTTPEGFDIAGDEDTSADEAGDWVAEWCERARSLWEDTPRSVVGRLRRAEDNAVAIALMERQKLAEGRAQALLDEEAQLHRDAQEKERMEKSEANRDRTNRARLLSYYRKYNPDKESNIDVILKTYDGRLDVLDSKLAVKYGHGFSPIIKPASLPPLSKNTRKLLSTMNQGFNRRKQAAEATKKKDRDVLDNLDMKNAVTVTVSSTEVLPIICWTRESSAANVTSAKSTSEVAPLKYYLVDSRAEATVQEEGRFPTALSMSPEALMDPDRIRQLDDMFESLRGAVHIVVMGEGFSSVPALYGIQQNPKLQQLTSDDDSRTSLCALFFVKKGFPFVSILDGGFAAAHAWLIREGPNRHLYANSVLVDYHGELSLFGQLERQHQDQHAAPQVRTQRAIQNMFESSMASITLYQRRFEKTAKESETPGESLQNVQESVKKFFSRPDTDVFHSSPESVESRFKNPFAAKTSEEINDPSEGGADTGTLKNPFAGMGSKLAEIRKYAETAKSVEKSSLTNTEQSGEEVVKANEVPTSVGNEQSRVMSAFAGIGKQVAKLRSEVNKPVVDSVATPENKSSEKTDISRFRIPFGGGKRVAAPESDIKEEGADFRPGEGLMTPSVATVAADASTAIPPSPVQATGAPTFSSSLSRMAQAANSSLAHTVTVQPETEGVPKINRFAGLSASLNKRVEQVNEKLKSVNIGVDNTVITPPKLPEVLKTNPFGRFSKASGSGGDVAAPAAQKQNRFGGLNVNISQMRSSAMQRVINLRTRDVGTGELALVEQEEEHISFAAIDENSPLEHVSTTDSAEESSDEITDDTVVVEAEIVKV